MRVEILHIRDPDYECAISVWIDGVPVTTEAAIELDVVDIDPGRGYEREVWDEDRANEAANPNYSEAFRKAVLEAHDNGSSSQYITD